MNRIVSFAVFMIIVTQVSAQEKAAPYTLNAEYRFDIVNNFAGGRKTGAAYVGRMDAMLSLQTGEAGWYRGGTFFIRGINAHGTTPSLTKVGDIQPVSRIEASSRTSLFEFWYRQDWRKLSLMAGQIDMNSLMATNPLASSFLNTSFGIYPSVALNASLSIYPAASASLYAQFKPAKKITIRGGAFDSEPLPFANNQHNIKWRSVAQKGILYTGEFEFQETVNDKVIGHYKFGGYINTAKSYNVTDSSSLVESSGGVYVTAYRQVMEEIQDSNQGLSVFLQAGTSPGAESFVSMYLSTGFTYKGLFRNRHKDVLGIGMVYSGIKGSLEEQYTYQYTRGRTLIELHYGISLGDHFYVQPDLQYIIHTGASPFSKNSFIGLLRGMVRF